MDKKILVTGGNSGLGKYIHEKIQNSINLTRKNSNDIFENFKNQKIDLIIHCAFGAQGGYHQNDIKDHFKYVSDNILLTKQLLDLPHNKFIYLSSLAVYDKAYSNYKLTKLYAESMVKTLSKNYLIIRPSSMIGLDMRENNLFKIIKYQTPSLSLTPNSELNLILHSDILKFIYFATSENITDTVDFVSSKNITIERIAQLVGKYPVYGNYNFQCATGDTKKIQNYMPSLVKTSEESFIEFYRNYIDQTQVK